MVYIYTVWAYGTLRLTTPLHTSQFRAVSIHVRCAHRCGHPIGLGKVCTKQLLDIIRLTGCMSQPPDSVPPQQLSGGGAIRIRAAVEALHLPQASVVEGLQLCSLCRPDS